jgi:Flp pilus assembly protein CpaB
LPVTISPDGVGTRTDGNGRRSARTITRPSRLPSGRAVFGALLVTLSALGTFLAVTASDSQPADRFVVATRSIDEGERLDRHDVRLVAMDLPAGIAQHAFRDAATLDAAVVLAPIREGSLIEASQVLPADTLGDDARASSHELSLRLSRAQALDGAVNRGERVDVLATYGTGVEAATVVVARDAIVTALGSSDDPGLGDDGGLTLTLRVPDDDTVLRLTHAKDVALVTLVRATRDDGRSSDADRYDGPQPSPSAPQSAPAAR